MGAKPRPTKRHRQTPDPIAAAVGARIRAFRNEQDFSFDAFVEVTGLGRGYVSELERGLVVPTVVVLDRVARALSVTIADLVLADTPREQLFEAAATLGRRDLEQLLDQVRARAAKHEASRAARLGRGAPR